MILDWRPLESTPFEVRVYPDHGAYCAHQWSETDWRRDKVGLAERGIAYRTTLYSGLLGLIPTRGSVLCLGARNGSEVQAFLMHGCFAVGVDLNPPPLSNLVLAGDFHVLPWPRGSVDMIFTNSLDHSIYPDALFNEICRLLRPSGYLIIHAVVGTDEGFTFGQMECLRWRRIQDVVDFATRFPLVIRERREVQDPWSGELILWQRNP